MDGMVSVKEYKSMNTRWMILLAFVIFMFCLSVMYSVTLYFTSDYEYVADTQTITNTNTTNLGGDR